MSKSDGLTRAKKMAAPLDKPALDSAIQACETPPQAKSLHDKAEALRKYYKSFGGHLAEQNACAEAKIEAAAKCGELLASPDGVRAGNPQLLQTARIGLDDVGIEATASHRFQAIASVPVEMRKAYYARRNGAGGEVFMSEVLLMSKFFDSGLDLEAILAALDKNMSMMQAKRAVLAETIAARGTTSVDGHYRIIYADPPWSYGNTMPDTTVVPEDHYPPMSLEAICDLEVAPGRKVTDVAEDDAVLFLWTTSPHLEESFEVIKAWGFSYKSSFVWDKVKHNMGHYNSVRHEFLLVCTRGSCQPDVHKLYDSVVSEERTEHSKKPDLFYEIIDTIYPHGARLELFSRRARDGWTAWGFEAPDVAA